MSKDNTVSIGISLEVDKEALVEIMEALYGEPAGYHDDLLEECYRICKEKGKMELAQQFAERAVNCRTGSTDFKGYAYEYKWAGETALQVDMPEQANKLLEKAVFTFVSDLAELGLSAFGDYDDHLLDELSDIAEQLGMKAERELMLKRASQSYAKAAEETTDPDERQEYENSAKEVAGMIA